MKPIQEMVVAPMALMAVSALLVLNIAGCKTDALFGPTRRAPEGPVTSLENPAGIDLPEINIVECTEVDLVEEMLLHRAMYARFLGALETYYTEHGYSEKAAWARHELNDLGRVKPYGYIEDAIAPVASLRPTESIAEADKLYEDGRALMTKGGHGIPVLYNQETMKLALAKFKELVEQYPTSDKIDDAAYWIAEIHKEYLEEQDNTIAVLWYQRAIEWNPDTPHPARFQMAVVYDYRLHEREKALEMYQRVVEEERFNRSNVDYAHVRIHQLTAERTRHAPGEPVTELRPEPTGSPAPTDSPKPGEETTEAIKASPPPPPRVP